MKPYKELTLRIEDEEGDFFEDCYLIAIGSPFPIYKLCVMLNQAFGVEFSRSPEKDVALGLKALQSPFVGWETNLFSHIDIEQSISNYDRQAKYFHSSIEKVIFPLYEYKFPLSETHLILYSNQQSGRFLLPEWKQADYFYLIQNVSGKEDIDKYVSLLSQVSGISWNKRVDIQKLRNGINLII